MIIEWTNRKDGSTTDITQLITSVSWGGSTSQAARTAEVAVTNAPDDKNIVQLTIATGDVIQLYENSNLVFYGEVQTREKTSETGMVTYNCNDLLIHLLKSTAVYNFADTTAEDITKKVCADFSIEMGTIAETKATIKKMIVDGSTIYDIIMLAYTKAARQTGEKYICRMDGTKLLVEIKGTQIENFVLAEEYNITNTSYQETIENMANVIKIYDDTGKQIGEIKNDEWVKQYGVYQQTYKKEKGVNETLAAENLLNGIEMNVTLEGINGDLKCVAGNGVEVYDKSTGLSGLFWIDSDTHVWENGTHTMSLELNFKNIMDSKEDSNQET